jgi:predicted MFS family arabinose efflux permease
MNEFLKLLKNKNFVFLWIAQILSQLADKIFFLFMIVLVTKNSFSNSSVSILTVFFTIPSILFSAIAGVFVDRWDKKYIMILSNVFRSFFVVILPFSESIYYIYFITFFVSTFTQFFAPAESSLMPALVKKEELLSANSLFMSTWLISIVIGFASGERLIHNFGENFAHFGIAIMYIIATISLIIVSSPKEGYKKVNIWDSFINELKEGWRYIIDNKLILYSLIRQIIIFSAFASLSVLVIGFVNDILYLKPAFFGYLLAIAGLGMTFGSLFVNKIDSKLGKQKVIFISFVLTGISLIILSFTNQVAKFFGMDKISQQKSFYNSISTLYKYDNNIFQDIRDLLSKDYRIKNKINFFYKISSLELKQLKALSNLSGIDIKYLYAIYNDEKLSKITIGSFLKRISSNYLEFKLKNNNFIKIDNIF